MNNARQLYLGSYFCVDAIDAMLAKVNLNYICWKYWHSGKRHADALAIVVVCDFYKELSTESLAHEAFGITSEELASFKPLDFHQFQSKMAKQDMKYDTTQQKYPGDKSFCCVTKLCRERRQVMIERENEIQLVQRREDHNDTIRLSKLQLIVNLNRRN